VVVVVDVSSSDDAYSRDSVERALLRSKPRLYIFRNEPVANIRPRDTIVRVVGRGGNAEEGSGES